MRILIVEDDENSRVLLATILDSCGYQTNGVSNGVEALTAITHTRPDLIISDIMMPEMDGFALCRAVKSHPDLAAIPFVFYSATYTTPPDIQLAEELGASLFLIKPMDPEDLIAQIQRMLPLTAHAAALPPIPAVDGNALDAKYAGAIVRKLDKKVAELKTLQTRLNDSEDQLRRIQESYHIAQHIAHTGCWSWVVVTDRFWWSDELYSLFGLEPEPAIDRAHLLAQISTEDRDRFDRALTLIGEKGISFSMDHGFYGPDQMLRMAHSEAQVVELHADTGRPLRIVCAMRDITEQRQMEKDKSRLEAFLRQSQKMEALGTLAGGIAHDFNNILNAVLCHAETLLEDSGKLPDQHRNALQEIVTASQRAADLVRQIRLFSQRAENTSRKPSDLAVLVTEVLSFIRPAIPLNVIINVDDRETVPPVPINSTQIYQVILNLCLNACRAMRPDGGKLTIQLRTEQISPSHALFRLGATSGLYAVLSVSDTGCGMDELTRERIFEPFFSTKTGEESSGLGLSVVQGIVLSHNGYIQVDTSPGQGTTFAVYLPIPPA